MCLAPVAIVAWQPRAEEREAPAKAEESAEAAVPNLFKVDRIAGRRLKLAEQRIAVGEFGEAADLLQAVLDAEEDSAAPVDGDEAVFHSLKGKALLLLESLPAEGKRVYELKYGVAAEKRLAESIARGDWPAVEEISRRFFHTTAGYKATYRLAVRAQDRSEPLHAAILFERLAETSSREAQRHLRLRSAVAWSQAGFPEAAREAADRIAEQDEARLTLGGQNTLTADDADELLNWIEGSRGSRSALRDSSWPMFGRSVDRNADVSPITVAGGAEWRYRFDTPTAWDPPREAAEAARLAATLEDVTSTAVETGELTQPAFSPVVAGNAAIFRTLHGIQAVDLNTGEFLWRTERPHDVVYDRALDGINLFTRPGNPFEGGASRALFLEEYVAQSAWRNLTSGTLSTDGTFVYGIEGVGTAGVTASAPQGGPRNEPIGSDPFNSLYAYEIAADGRIAWTAGGPPERDGATGRFFLGPPLPLGGRLYALAEEEGEIRLVAIDPSADRDDERILWSQSLVGVDAPVAARAPMFADPLRKLSGLSPSFSDGILICPTGTGAVVAVDLAQRQLLWGYRYPRNIDSRPAGAGRRVPFMMVRPAVAPNDEADRWLDAFPQISNGLVFLTPRDSDDLHCVDLRSGRLLWKRPRGSALYLAAVHEGRAVLVGRREIAAYDAETGDPHWTQPLHDGDIAGRGVRSGTLYHVPLTTNEIVTLRLSTGQELGRSPLGEDVSAGNLIAADGRLISQSTEMIAAFPKLDEFEVELRDRLRDGGDPVALALRGEDRLHRGETESGITDLQQAIATTDLPRARILLTEVLLEGLRTDFAAYRKYEDDLIAITDDPQQRLQFLRLFADGLEQAGETQAAFQRYLRLSDQWPATSPIELNGEGIAVRADRTLRVRIASLYAQSDAADRQAMDATLVDHLRDLESTNDTDSLERFASLFRETPVAAAGLNALAARYEAAGDRLRHDLSIRRLAEESVRQPLKIGQVPGTSSIDLFENTYHAEYVPDEIKSGRREPDAEMRFAVRVIGSRPAFFTDWSFEIDASRRHLQARDTLGQLRWKVAVRPPHDADAPLRYVHAAQIRFNGSVMAFAAGDRLVVCDTSNAAAPRVLWTRDLKDRRLGDLSINRNQFRRAMVSGQDGPVCFAGAETLIYQAGTSVIAADPITGDTLWQRPRLPVDCSFSGDFEYLLVKPPASDEVTILRTVDGSNAGPDHLRSIEGFEPVQWQGTQVISWLNAESSRDLVCRDVARGADLWSRSFPATARLQLIGTDEAAVLVPESGEIQTIRMSDGANRLRVHVDPDPEFDFFPLRSEGRLLVFTRKSDPLGVAATHAVTGMVEVEGPAWAFDSFGERLWSTTLPRQHLPTSQSTGLPILFLTTAVHAADRPASHRAAILDVRTGKLLLEQQREGQFLPFETKFDSERGTLTVAVRDGKFLLTPIPADDRR